ncbi:response regulator transcription factor [Polaribacter batillariae]|uniref:Response regulator transcription factor n=1 Tax=Polaribacter batillariae TaxID=2808900 RepID=A0ABX7STT6_9FLAO|nr:LytTR family DNA-binding domain-containing protein [Polaribacter batillariae]QTD36765.1 response regulator transcription factor [Polaribacter batillariae]
MKKYKALIIDDDLSNINLLKIYLNKFCPMTDVVAEALDVNAGVRAYLETKPDLLFLDINLGNDDAFSFLDSIGKTNAEIILISSHTSYGVKAVNYNVTGYVLKPIDVEELKKIIHKAFFNIETKNRVLQETDKDAEVKREFPDMIAVPSIKKVELISVDSIDYLEADGKYTIFHQLNEQTKIASRNLGEYEKILDPKVFFRIHHRFLVKTSRITSIHKTDGNYCELANGKTLPIAKRKQDDFNKYLRLK